ncbi:translation elongation factor 4 [Helicobacter sp. MIT 14-3879]|uniref:translation elongation factor 4 n=1 Tax=Helicobacter sp. MIT 14-3879 TaxID=2040649 RepID=UPI000E1F75C2|nr:translation elongation factor 4 [Helicobacter sp. MIT 14-3879]RDU59977.1 elongation factor 4 [Helicobacter sp. MIT 14-3879]
MQANIRNFSIIAHIDHGKSTIADCLLQACGSIAQREITAQIMDTMDIEKERGITIKAQSARLTYKAKDSKEYIFNLIDTPGHVDFSYEVSRSLKSCEGVLLVVDASQGIQAQTIANVYIALENNLEIIPVINKIDLPAANPPKVIEEIEEILGLDCSHAVLVSAKTGEGIESLLEAITKRIPPPKIEDSKPLKALVYDSWFDNYLGALGLIRIMEGQIQKGDMVMTMSADKSYQVLGLEYPHPIHKSATQILKSGEIGILNLGLKSVTDIAVGDTITLSNNPTSEPIEGFMPAKPFVFAGIYPLDTNRFEDLRDALKKLKLNDCALQFEPESSIALGFGFRVGFLGLLHMEVVKERLEREFGLDLIASAPTVVYEVCLTDGNIIQVQNPSELPPEQRIASIKEPFVRASIITPSEFLGNVIVLLNNKRGIQENMEYLSQNRVLLTYSLPSNEIIMDFYDKLKSQTKGYASFDYEPIGYKEGNLIKLDVRVAGEIVDALSVIIDKSKSYERGKALVAQMKEIIPRQLFEVAIQASIGNKVIARETVKSMGKNVTAKCYGGDITRKRKLLEKQKEGKRRLKAIGKVEIPQEAFLAVLKID